MVQSVPLHSVPRDQMREERLDILRLLETGAITIDEAARLLDALDLAALPPLPDEMPAPRSAAARQVRIRVADSASGKSIVNVAFPLGLIKAGLDIAGQFVPDYLPKVEAIQESVSAGFRGSLLDVDDGGERVEIIVE